jgi:long-chain acyl-CoA synthetase
MNLATILTDSAQADPDHIALRLDDMEVSYGLLDEGSARIATLLTDRGLEPGDRVGIMLPNVPYFGVCYYGVLRAGGVIVPMNVLLKRREVAFYLKDSGAKLMFAWDDDADAGAQEAGAECIVVKPGEFEEMVAGVEPRREVVDRDPDDTAVILYTSGTTGTPKGAELTHNNLTENCKITRDMFGIGGDVVTLGALPLFHSFGQTCSMNATIAAGGTLSLIPRFDPGKALEIIERDKINLFQGVPTMYSAILHYEGHDKVDTSSLELCVSGGSAMPVELMRGF